MKKLKFSISINAKPEKIWKILLQDDTYRKWTEPFHPGSYAVTDWQEGSKAVFLTPEGKGMISNITENIPNKFLSIHHIGIINNGAEDTVSEEAKIWAESYENYTLNENQDFTEFIVETELPEDFADMIAKSWDKALIKLKELCEI